MGFSGAEGYGPFLGIYGAKPLLYNCFSDDFPGDGWAWAEGAISFSVLSNRRLCPCIATDSSLVTLLAPKKAPIGIGACVGHGSSCMSESLLHLQIHFDGVDPGLGASLIGCPLWRAADADGPIGRAASLDGKAACAEQEPGHVG